METKNKTLRLRFSSLLCSKKYGIFILIIVDPVICSLDTYLFYQILRLHND